MCYGICQHEDKYGECTLTPRQRDAQCPELHPELYDDKDEDKEDEDEEDDDEY